MEVTSLELEIKTLQREILTARRKLKNELQNDDLKIKVLSSVCYGTQEYLQKLRQKGVHILNLSDTCKKFETEREKLNKYLPVKYIEFTEELQSPDNPVTEQAKGPIQTG